MRGNKSCNESVKRESELCKMVGQAAIDERQEHKERSMIKDLLQINFKRGKKRRRKQARGLIEEMQRILDEAQV